MLELMVGVALAKKQHFPALLFLQCRENRNAAFSDQLYVFLLSFTLPKAGKPWLVTLRMAKCIFTHASEKI